MSDTLTDAEVRCILSLLLSCMTGSCSSSEIFWLCFWGIRFKGTSSMLVSEVDPIVRKVTVGGRLRVLSCTGAVECSGLGCELCVCGLPRWVTTGKGPCFKSTGILALFSLDGISWGGNDNLEAGKVDAFEGSGIGGRELGIVDRLLRSSSSRSDCRFL